MNNDGNSITLEKACINGYLDCVKIMHKIGFNPSSWTSFSKNPLYVAYINKQDEVLDYFINIGLANEKFMYIDNCHFIFIVMKHFLIHKEERYLKIIKSLYENMTDPSRELFNSKYKDESVSFNEFIWFPYEILKAEKFSDIPVKCEDTLKRLNDYFIPESRDRNYVERNSQLKSESRYNPDNNNK